MNEVRVTDNPAQHCYELHDGKQLGGVLRYEDSDGERVFTHTEVPPEHEGKGYGSKLARAGLDEARRAGVKVQAQCDFIDAYMTRHPEYADLRSARDSGGTSRPGASRA